MTSLRLPTLAGALLALVAGATAAAAQGAPAPRPPRNPAVVAAESAMRAVPRARAEDVSSPDAIIATLYDVISGPAGKRRDWDRMRSLFAPGARLIPLVATPEGGAVPIVWSVEDYIQRAGPRLESEGFFEREVARTTESFGSLVHAFSTYESRRTPEEQRPFTRGINSIQLLRDARRYWVISIAWDSERPGNDIPARYLGGRPSSP